MVLRSSFPALQHRNFRPIWIGLLLSFSGSSMQSAVLLWHVSLLADAEHKGLALGTVGLVRVLPIVVFSLLSGVVADAWDRRRVMLYTQTGSALVALGLAAATFSGVATLWPIYSLAAAGAAIGAFDLPARQALIPTLVPREHLPNAITLNSMMFQLASVLGPFAGGMLMAHAGIVWVYLANAVSFAFVIVALVLMRDEPERRRSVPTAEGVVGAGRDDVSLRSALEGLRFVFQSPLIWSTMWLDFLVTFFASATALLPIFAQDVLHVGADAYGWLYAAPAVGAFTVSALMVPLGSRMGQSGRVLVWAVVGHGLVMIGFGVSRSFVLTFACLAIAGATDMISTIIRNVIRQFETPDRLRGRMTGVNMVFFMGGPQLGEAEAGLVAHWWSAPFSVVSGGIACLCATAWVVQRTPALRRYRGDGFSSLKTM